MRYNTTINNLKANEWGLNIQQAYLFSWMYELPSWAAKVMIENEIYFFASKTKAIEELPILTDKSDTMYRYYKQLEELDLIVLKKIDSKDYIRLTEKAKKWNDWQSDNSEINPNELGNKSENNSEINPTYNIHNINNNIIDKERKFKLSVLDFKNKYPIETLKDFFEYWSEKNESKTKMRFQLEKVFDISRRLATWDKNSKNFNKKDNTQKPLML